MISDSHGNVTNLKHVMEFAKKIKVGAAIHCGDWDNMAAVETVLAYKIPVYSVLGNADIDPKIAEIFKRTYLELKLGDKKVGVIHDMGFLPRVDILFCGHTHEQYEQTVGGLRVVNSGALEHTINFAVYDTKTDKVELIHE